MFFPGYGYTGPDALQGAWAMKGIRVRSAYALVIFFLGFAATVASAQNTVSAVPAQQRPGPQGLYKAAQMSKAGMRLVRAVSEHRSHVNLRRTTPFVPSDRFLPFSAGNVLVEARATADGAQLLNDLRQLGLTGGSRYGELVSGYIPVAAIEDAAALTSLRSISAAIAPIRNVGDVTSQGDAALQAAVARTTYNVDGSGIKVGVLSDSFDDLGGAAADMASGDLPAVQVLAESTACGVLIFCIDEGRAMLQIIYDMAPGADLMFHTGLQSKADYANGITALAAAGADVIVDDLLYLHEPMFQDGIVAQAVDSVVAGGAVYYSAAGNAGDESYEGTFIDSGNILCIEFFLPPGDCHDIYERVGRMHDFDDSEEGEDLVLTVNVPVDRVLTVAMQWDEPFGGAGPKADHDVVLLSPDGSLYYDISANDNVQMGEGWEVLQFENSDFLYNGETTFGLAITYDDVDSIGPPAQLLKLVVFGSGNSIGEHDTHSSTLYGHANAAGAVAVGAAYWDDTPAFGTIPALLEPYSSKGGTDIYFNVNGSSKPAPENRMKPEVTAVDGVDTTFFFSDPDGDGTDNFFGTSAAAPHAAGIAALMLDAQAGATPAQVNAALESSALDMNTTGFDYDSGYGLIQADAAIATLQAGGGNTPPMAGFTFTVNNLDVDFTDTSADSNGSIVSWSWDFGDSNGSNAQNPSHTYAADGNYMVQLTVTDDGGESDVTSQQVSVSSGGGVVNEPPVANFTYSCNARDCMFNASDSTDDVDVTSYSWNFGDGGISSGVTASHPYASQGNYTVTLTVMDAESQSDSVSASFRVKNRGSTSGSTGGDSGDTTIEAEKGRKKCSDGIDNDGDMLIDGDDPDCQ
jgi:PKD repeat protein